MPVAIDDPAAFVAEERFLCQDSPHYFVDSYCSVFDANREDWLPFRLWPAQFDALDAFHDADRVVALKARQLGFSWLAVAYALWRMLFRPHSVVLFFSKRDDEAVDLLDFRLKEMHAGLPAWLRAPGASRLTDAKHGWRLANGSRALAFPTTGGRSYTASLVVVDEADWVADLARLLKAVKPTVDAGGKLLLLSTSDKDAPQSEFKRLYRAARAGQNTYRPVFHGWQARPDRDEAWYARQCADMLPDDVRQEYPATDDEALARRAEGAEFPDEWFGEGIWFDDWPGGLQLRAAACDPSKSRDSKRGDYAAFVVACLDGAGTIWAEAELLRASAAGVVDTGYDFAARHGPDGFAWETNQMQELFAVMLAQKAEALGVPPLPLYSVQNRVAKDVRIRRLAAPWLAGGRLKIRDTPGGRLLVEQLREFPGGEHDDGPDALEMAVRLLDYLYKGRRGEHAGGFEPLRG